MVSRLSGHCRTLRRDHFRGGENLTMPASHQETASDYALWRARFDDAMTEAEFNAIPVEHKVRLLREIETFITRAGNDTIGIG